MPGFSGIYLTFAALGLIGLIGGYAFVHAGLVRSKNVLSGLTQHLTVFAVAVIFYLLFGYNITHNQGILNGLLPQLQVMWHGKSPLALLIDRPQGSSAIGELLFLTLVACLVMPIVVAAVAERVKLVAIVLFAIVMSSIIYPVAAFWVTPTGFLGRFGFQDVGGAVTLQVVGAMAALAALLMIGARQQRFDSTGRSLYIPASNIPLAMLGSIMVLVGFLSLNSGAQLLQAKVPMINGVAWTLLISIISMCTSVLASLLLVRFIYGKADLTFILNGLVVGLIAVSAGPIMNIDTALIIGLMAAVLMVFSNVLLFKLKIDDPVGVIAVHGMGGFWAVFAVSFSQPHHSFAHIQIADWSWYQQLWIQLSGFAVIAAWAFVMSLFFWWLIRALIGLRVNEITEVKGLDIMDNGMPAYPEFLISNKR